jgi:NitT/TauT family transport system permease protein/taurine transport system permease protein
VAARNDVAEAARRRALGIPWGMFAAAAVAVGLWGAASRMIPQADLYLPSPGAVGAALMELLAKGILPDYMAESLRRVVLATAVGLVIGVPLGILIGINSKVAEYCYPLLNFFQSLGGIAILPLVIVWFGFTEKTILVAINYTVLFPVVFNVLVGVRSVPRIYVNALRTLGASRLRIVRDVLLPGALPHVATGARLGMAYGWRALIAAEMLVGANGLGFMIFNAQSFFLTNRIILGMLVIGTLWVLIDRFVLRPLEADTIQRWGLVQR